MERRLIYGLDRDWFGIKRRGVEKRLRNTSEYREIRKIERPQTRVEQQIFKQVQSVFDDFRKRGHKWAEWRLNQSKVHIVPVDYFDSPDSTVCYRSDFDEIIMASQESKIEFLVHAIHESLHAHSHNALYANEDEKVLTQYRSGLVANSVSGEKEYFRNLNEAVITELTKTLTREVLDETDFFDDETTATEEYLAEHDVVSESGESLIDDDTYHVNISSYGSDGEPYEVNAPGFSYKQERAALGILVDLLSAKLGLDRNAVFFDYFVEATMNGNLLPLAKAIDHSFGKGTFRRIGELGDDTEGLTKLIESLNKQTNIKT